MPPLKNCSDWESTKRKGQKVGFLKFRSRRKDQARARFAAGAVRVEPDRRTITLPVVGALRSMENTRRLERLVRSGKARILNATLKKRWGRLLVSFSCLIEDHPRPAPTNAVRAGVDLGIWVAATIADSNGDIAEV